LTEKLSLLTAAIFAAVAMAAQVTLPAAAQQPHAAPDQAGLGNIDLGKTTYAQKCSHCHGPNMVNSGTITPDLRTFPDDRTRFVTTVKQGKNGRMPPWGDILSDGDIANVWAYISSRRNP
jgi:mono/diheme cytochrome c family protein